MGLHNFALVEVEMGAGVDNVVVGGHIDDLQSVVKVKGDGLRVGGAPLFHLQGPVDGLGCEESWTAEEVKNFRLGYIDLDEGEGKTFPESEGRPDLLDHREAGLVTEVKGQGSCGSCWAFSATGGIEGVWALKVGELLSVSEQQLMDCGPGSCSGGNMAPAWDSAKDGIMSEEDYPYERKEGECRYNSSQAVASVTGHETVAHNEHDLEKALYQIGYPISIAVHAGSSFQHYKV